MTLTETDIELIRASWIPARTDPIGAGILLFKGLFTKFPDYLKFFNQFADLELERMHDNKRLVRHATKVIDTVTFVVDSIGDPSKADQLQEALINLVRSHLKRRIGQKEFYNLGLVLIDFVCDLNTRRHHRQQTTLDSSLSSSADLNHNNNSRLINNNNNNNNNNSSASSSQDSETMTIALDKIRASSSPSSSSEDENLLARSLAISSTTNLDNNNDQAIDTANYRQFDPCERQMRPSPTIDRRADHQILADDMEDLASSNRRLSPTAMKLDLKLVVGAWKELYGIIMNLVRSEEGQEQHANDHS